MATKNKSTRKSTGKKRSFHQELDFPTRANLPKGKFKTLALKNGYKVQL